MPSKDVRCGVLAAGCMNGVLLGTAPDQSAGERDVSVGSPGEQAVLLHCGERAMVEPPTSAPDAERSGMVKGDDGPSGSASSSRSPGWNMVVKNGRFRQDLVNTVAQSGVYPAKAEGWLKRPGTASIVCTGAVSSIKTC